MSTGDYSPADHDHSAPLELEASTEDTRPPEAGTAVEGLTVAEAASAYGLSVSTVRRLLSTGKLTGAAKVPGPKGAEYRIPPEALETLGYRAKETRAGAVLTAARASLEAEELARRVTELEASLEVERVLRQSAETRATDLEANLADLRSALAKLPAAIEPPKRGGLFRRKRQR